MRRCRPWNRGIPEATTHYSGETRSFSVCNFYSRGLMWLKRRFEHWLHFRGKYMTQRLTRNRAR